jgi:predicted dehydrogenase
MKISVIGAGRTRNGIGEYIGKYFHKLGGEVTSILGTTEKTTLQASSALRKYGIEARPYTDFNEMVRIERPDGVAIASPSSTHYEYLLRSLDSGLHIFCEKPFIRQDAADIRKRTEEICEKGRERGLTIAMDSQWPFSIDSYEEICGKVRVGKSNSFFIKMSPPFPGREMIPESVPHALSLLYCLLGEGEIEDLNFESSGEEGLNIRFVYRFGAKRCDVFIGLAYQKAIPRDFSFGLNGKVISRSLDLENYEIYFIYGDKKLRIVDPVELSVKNFMEAVEKKTEPFIGTRHILHNLSLLEKINSGFGEFQKRNPWKS